MGIDSNVCFTHFGPIWAKYGHNAKICEAKNSKGDFWEQISRLTNQSVARIVPATFVNQLRNECKGQNRGRLESEGMDWPH